VIQLKRGDRVKYHGAKTKWRGKTGIVPHADNKNRFALVVPDSGLTKGFDVRWSFIDLRRVSS
jgi:hypothetical protein